MNITIIEPNDRGLCLMCKAVLEVKYIVNHGIILSSTYLRTHDIILLEKPQALASAYEELSTEYPQTKAVENLKERHHTFSNYLVL